MKKVIFCALFLITVLVVNSQKVYDIEFDTIKQVIESNPNLYQELGKRFIENDTTLEGIDYLLLYYGGAYTENYSPYGERGLISSVDELIEEEKYDEAIERGLEILQENPGMVELYYSLTASYHLTGDTIMAQSYYEKYVNLLSIPYYSGNGLEKDSAFVVRIVRDEYLILEELGYKLESQHLIIDEETGMPYDLMKVVDESGNEEELYFNIYQPYIIGMQKMFGGEESDEKNKKKDKRKEKKKKRKNKNKKNDKS